MSAFEEEVLYGALLDAHSWRLLHDPEVSGKMDAEEILELYKQAGYSENQAQKAATARANARLDVGLSP